MVFSSDDDILLVTFVEKNPFLYDRKHKYYCRPAVKNAIWEEIGKELGKTGAECKSRWSSLRTCYKQSRRIKESGAPDLSVYGPNEIRVWSHEEMMSFLDKPPAKKFSIITAIAEGDTNARLSFPSVAEQASEVEPTTSRRSRGEEDDDVNLFLKSVEKKIKQLPPDMVAEIQAKTFSLLAEMVSNALINQPVPGSSGAK